MIWLTNLSISELFKTNEIDFSQKVTKITIMDQAYKKCYFLNVVICFVWYLLTCSFDLNDPAMMLFLLRLTTSN